MSSSLSPLTFITRHLQAIFELDYFRSKPGAFYHLAKEMWPDGRYKPTLSHYFLCLMHRKGILLRCFSQNIGDSLPLQTYGFLRTLPRMPCALTLPSASIPALAAPLLPAMHHGRRKCIPPCNTYPPGHTSFLFATDRVLP